MKKKYGGDKPRFRPGITIPRNYPEQAVMTQNDPERAKMISSEP